jgi:hypothetical protein
MILLLFESSGLRSRLSIEPVRKRNPRGMSPSVGLKSQATQNQPAPATTVAPAGEQSSATDRCMPLIALKAA